VYRLNAHIKAAHLAGKPDRLVTEAPLASMAGDWRAYLSMGLEESMPPTFRRHKRTGRPLGSPAFLDRLEILLQRPLRPRRPGHKRKDAEE